MVVEAIAKRHGIAPWRRRFQGVAAEGALGGESVLLLLPGTFMNESGRAVAEAAHFYKLELARHRGVPRRDRSAARQGAGEDRRRHCRPQRPALDLRAYRQRLSPRAHRRRPSRRQGPGARATCSATSPRTSGRWVEALCDIIADNAGAAGRRARTRASRTRCISPWQAKGFGDARSRSRSDDAATEDIERLHGFQMRHRRPAECRQVDALQCADRRPRRRRRRTIRSAPSSRMSARSRCPIRGSTCSRSSPSRREIIPTRLTFVDIAGLVRGASKGEGLGNQFLANIREVDAIAHVVRCFEDADVTHVEGRIDPIADIETVETELMLADLDSLEKRVDALEKKAKGGDKEAQGDARSGQPRARAAARRQAGAPGRAQAGGGEGCSTCSACSPRCRCSMSAMSTKASAATGNAFSRQVEARAKAGRRGRGRHLGQDRGRDRAAAAAPSAPNISKPSASKEPGLDRLIRAGYELLASGHLFHRRPEGGARLDHHARAPRRRRRRASSTPISSAASSAPRPSPMTTIVALGGEAGAQGRRQDAARRQGLRRRRRRRDAFPLCDLVARQARRDRLNWRHAEAPLGRLRTRRGRRLRPAAGDARGDRRLRRRVRSAADASRREAASAPCSAASAPPAGTSAAC